jgi:hypothetical protein
MDYQERKKDTTISAFLLEQRLSACPGLDIPKFLRSFTVRCIYYKMAFVSRGK